jgi:lysozyme family protein
MSDRFEICHPITAAWEGGWSNHKADPGGKTMYGVTEASWHAYQDKVGMKRTPVRLITKAQALAFYRSEFWDKINGDQLHPGVDLATHDASVNSGVSRGLKWLKAAAGSDDHSVTVRKVCRARLSFMQSLKIWKTFGKGWGRRVADIEVKGVAMALAAMGATPSRVQADARAEAAAAKTSAATVDKAAKTTATGAAGSASAPAIDPSALDVSALWILGSLAVVLGVVTVLLVIRQRAATARAEAYAEVLA